MLKSKKKQKVCKKKIAGLRIFHNQHVQCDTVLSLLACEVFVDFDSFFAAVLNNFWMLSQSKYE